MTPNTPDTSDSQPHYCPPVSHLHYPPRVVSVHADGKPEDLDALQQALTKFAAQFEAAWSPDFVVVDVKVSHPDYQVPPLPKEEAAIESA